ncbi:hypothetical protein PHO31112_05288 [Pandoraea horticolens]|uniref:Uncharacterized protein n=1 Tax=Pandoraea horticolens TaxID=2508298 RepID=A0A5E4ZC43_9BURK|nr:hypothetical protein PHO31112_05288 [Pandoraea horticolens]
MRLKTGRRRYPNNLSRFLVYANRYAKVIALACNLYGYE